MKKMSLIVSSLVSFGVVVGGVAIVSAGSNAPDRPSWVGSDGKSDLSKMPDNTKLSYACWSGKTVTLDSKAAKKVLGAPPAPGTPEYEAGVAKSQELSKIPGVVTEDAQGKRTMNIDDDNPEVQKIMKKYEAKEVPQCL